MESTKVVRLHQCESENALICTSEQTLQASSPFENLKTDQHHTDSVERFCKDFVFIIVIHSPFTVDFESEYQYIIISNQLGGFSAF